MHKTRSELKKSYTLIKTPIFGERIYLSSNKKIVTASKKSVSIV